MESWGVDHCVNNLHCQPLQLAVFFLCECVAKLVGNGEGGGVEIRERRRKHRGCNRLRYRFTNEAKREKRR
jgi:hypothetical protein